MVLVAIPFVVQAVAATPYHSAHDEAFAVTSGTVNGAEGCHYFLNEDLSATGDIVVSGKVNLCLNGHTLDLGAYSLRPNTGAVLTICDCSAEETGTIYSTANAINTDFYEGYNGDVTLYSGKIVGNTAVYQGGEGVFTVYGGAVHGTAIGVDNQLGTTVVAGGSVSAEKKAAIDNRSTLTVSGGTVASINSASISSSGTLTISGGTVKSENALSVSVTGGVFNLSGAPVIRGGKNDDDIMLATNQKITITAPLTYSTENKLAIYISQKILPYTFTSGWTAMMGEKADFADYFEEGSNKEQNQYALHKGEDGELLFTGHMHTWAYEVSDYVLTARCTREDDLVCSLDGFFGGTVTVNAPTDLVYSGSEKQATVENTLLPIVPATVSAITYEMWNGSGWESCAAPVTAGQYRAVVTVGKDSHITYVYGEFAIRPLALTGAAGTLLSSTYAYNGMAQKPENTLLINGVALKEGTDYTVRYLRSGSETTDLINAGTITVQAEGCGNYEGSCTLGIYQIEQLTLVITPLEQLVREGEALQSGLNYVQTVGLVGTDRLISVQLRQEGHEVLAGVAVLQNERGEDVNGNYVIDYKKALCHNLRWNETTQSQACTYPGCQVEFGNKDEDKPTGSLTVSTGSITATTTGFFGSISFDRYTNQALRVTVMAQDALSGLARVQYLWGYDVATQTEEELAARTDWQTYEAGGFTVPVKNGARVLIYVRLVDMAGNTAYLSLEHGLVFDLTPPTVSGVESGKTYYVTQQITISDLLSGIQLRDLVNCGWDLSAVNGSLRATLMLAGNTDCEYQFTLSDMLGNMAANGATVTVVMKPIATLAAPLAGLTIDNVTGYDAPVIREVRAAVMAVDTTYATQEEKDALQAIMDTCDALLAKVQNVDEVIRQVTDLLAGYDIHTVTSADRAAIAQAAADLAAVVAGNDLTSEQAEAIAPLQEKAHALLGRIDEVAAELDRIRAAAAAYDPHTVTLNDRTAMKQLIADAGVLLATQNLTVAERAELTARCNEIGAMLDSLIDVAAEIERLANALAQYNEETVKSSDKAAIDDILHTIDALLASTGLTAEEREALDGLRIQAVALLNKIAFVAEEIDRLNRATGAYSMDTVTSSDYATLQKLLFDFGTLLGGKNLTEAERTQLVIPRGQVSACLGRLDTIAAEKSRIEGAVEGYEAAEVSAADRTNLHRLLAASHALLAYPNHLEAERAEIEALRTRIEALLARIGGEVDEGDLLDRLYAYKVETVKSSDKQSIADLVEQINALLQRETLQEETRKQLSDGLVYAKTLTDKIDATLAELARLIGAVGAYDIETVKSSDRAAIAQLVADMQALLAGKNLTAAERASLEAALQTAKALLDRIDAIVAAVDYLTELITGYDKETVKPSDREVIDQLATSMEELLAGNNLTAAERTRLEEGLQAAKELLKTLDGDDGDEDKPGEDGQTVLDALLTAIAGYDIHTVKSTDRADIEALIGEIEALSARGDLADQHAQLAEALAKADALIKRIEAAHAATETEKIQAAASITPDNFKPSDRETVADAKADVEAALATYEGNYTEEEKQALLDELARLKAILHSMDRVEAIQEALDALPALDAFNRNNTEVMALIEAIKTAYGQLTPHEIELVDRSRLDAILAVLADYSIVLGNGSSWQKGSDFSLSFQANGPFAEFVGVKIDGVLLDAANYHVIDRDTVVNLLVSYLETLEPGAHSITILYENDEAVGTFRITEASVANSGNSYVWLIIIIIILCLAGGGLAVYFVMKREQRKENRTNN
jgi:hypothetical protein